MFSLLSNTTISFFFFFFNDTATTEIYTLSLHDALPISAIAWFGFPSNPALQARRVPARSEEHTSELQSRGHLVCRLLLEKKNQNLRRRYLATSKAITKISNNRLNTG